jgi:hypothetical protein
MAFVMEKDVTTNPVNIGLFSAIRIMTDAKRIGYLIQEFFWEVYPFMFFWFDWANG